MSVLASRAWGEVTWVYRSRGRDSCVAQDLLDDADVDVLLDEERCGGVPGVVEAAVSVAGFIKDGFPLSPVLGTADGAAVFLAEDEVVLLPIVAGHGSFEELFLLACFEQRQEFLRALEGGFDLPLRWRKTTPPCHLFGQYRACTVQPAPQVWRGQRWQTNRAMSAG